MNGWPKDTPPPAISPLDAAQARAHQEAWAKHLGVDVESTNSIGIEFVLGLKEKTMLGKGQDKLGDKEVQIPADCCLGNYEVTQEEGKKVMGENSLADAQATQPTADARWIWAMSFHETDVKAPEGKDHEYLDNSAPRRRGAAEERRNDDLLDVRTPAEDQALHALEARNLPSDQLDPPRQVRLLICDFRFQVTN